MRRNQLPDSGAAFGLHAAGRRRLRRAFKLAVTLLSLMEAVSPRVGAAEASAPIRLRAGPLQVGIEREHGSLVELRHSASRSNLVGETRDGTGVWELEVLENGKARRLRPANARAFHCEQPEGEAPWMRLCWEGFEVAGAPGLRVEVEVRPEAADNPGTGAGGASRASLSSGRGIPATARWEIAVKGLGGLALREARFPRVLNIPRQAEENLAVPVWLGQQTAEARRLLSPAEGKGRRWEWAYPGQLSMQCAAFYDATGSGLYLACDDQAAYRKTVAFFGDGHGNVSCEWVHLPETRERRGDAWTLPYAVRLGVFQGDWITAAEAYRGWATNQVWARESRLSRGQVPGWVLDTGLWVWNRGRSEEVLEPATVLQRRSELPVSVFWHWWHGCAYDIGFPEYLPPREGAERFRAAIGRAKANGLHTLVYMNQRLWGTTTASWQTEGAERFAVKGIDGKIHSEIYNTFTRAPCAPMCLGTGFWRDKYAGLATAAIQGLGVDGIYMDQACASLACYDAGHGHPVGGGTYWMDGFRELAQQIRRGQVQGSSVSSGTSDETRTTNANSLKAAPVLAGEGCGEPWLPHLDLMLSLQVSRERYAAPDGWDTIPLFTAVYHPYAVTYGNYSSLTMPPYDELWPAEYAPKEPLKLLDRKFSRQFYLEQARAFVWGQQPTIANFRPEQLEQRREEVEYVLRLARLRRQATKYLQYGTFLRPPEVQVEAEVLDISRLSIYAGQQESLKEFRKRLPLAIAGAWRAPDGSIAVALAGIAERRLKVTLEMDRFEPGLPEKARMFRLDERGRRAMGKAGKKPVQLELPARGACVLEFVSADRQKRR